MKTIRFAVLAILVITVAPALFAQKELPPEGSAPRDFTIPVKQTFTLPNGIAVTMVPYGSLPKVSVNVVVRAGNLNELANEVWLADIMGDLLKEGTPWRPQPAGAITV